MRTILTRDRPQCGSLLGLLIVLAISNCALDESTAPASSTALTSTPPTVALSADWLNGSVTWLDLGQLITPGGTLDGALIAKVNITTEGQQGPLQLVPTADGRRAVVLLSSGVMAFVGARLGIDTESLPATGAAVVIMDLKTREILAKFPVQDTPIMAAIDPDSDRVFVSLLGGAATNGSIRVYDLEMLAEVDRAEIAPFVEGLALNSSGTRGAVIGATTGLYLFDPNNLAGSLSQTPLKLADDSSGVAFIAGTDRLVVANSRNPSNYVVIDASNLATPVVLDEGDAVDEVPFMVSAVPGREEVVLPMAGDNWLRLIHLNVSQTPADIIHDIRVPDILTFPQAITVSPSGRYAFVGAATSKELLILDLMTGQVMRHAWFDDLGPTMLAVLP